MTFDRDFLEFMDRTVTVRQFSGYSTDGFSTRAYSSGYVLACYVERKHQLVKDSNGRDVVSTTTVYAPPYDNSTGQTQVTIAVQDQIVLPAGYNPSNSSTPPPIISVMNLDDDTGRYAQVVYL